MDDDKPLVDSVLKKADEINIFRTNFQQLNIDNFVHF